MTGRSVTASGTTTQFYKVGTRIRSLTARLLNTPLPGRRLPRYIERLNTVDRDYFVRPPIIANSFPHSGASLLMRIAEAFPEARNFGSIISSMPTIPFRERTDMMHDRLIRRIVPGEVVAAHIFFNDSHARRIAARNAIHLFIYRDLRDVAVAEAHYLTYVKFWHRLHPFFAGLKNDEERISAAIHGFAHDRFPYNYPNIAGRFHRFHGWLNRYDVLAVPYEDLLSERLDDTVWRMAHFYSSRCRSSIDGDRLMQAVRQRVSAFSARITPDMAPGVWRRAFTDEHIRQFEEVAGDLNRRLGYDETVPSLQDSADAERLGATVIPMPPRTNAPSTDRSNGSEVKMRRRVP